MQKGLFIVVEGIDGSGKSTLARNLSHTLEQAHLPVLLTKEPGGTSLGRHLRALVQDPAQHLDPKAEFLLFAADRAQHFTTLIIPALEKNTIVISDRCSDSSVAYQGYGRGLDSETIKMANRWAMQDRKPDITFYVRLDYETACERLRNRNESVTSFEQEKKIFFDRVITGFETLYKNRSDVVTLDGTLSQEKMLESALATIHQKLEAV